MRANKHRSKLDPSKYWSLTDMCCDAGKVVYSPGFAVKIHVARATSDTLMASDDFRRPVIALRKKTFR